MGLRPRKNRVPENRKFVKRFKPHLGDSAVNSCRKNLTLAFSEIYGSLPSSRLDARGTYRDRHDA